MGPKYGDAASVSYEFALPAGDAAQGLFSPRTVNIHFFPRTISRKSRRPTVVLHTPPSANSSRVEEGLRLCRHSPLSWPSCTRLKETVALIRQYAPQSKIVLGGYGTVLKDDVLKPYADHICRGEGVAYFRQLLGEPPIQMPYKASAHRELAQGVLAGRCRAREKFSPGWAAPTGCDSGCIALLCANTSRLLPEGKDIYAVVERYHGHGPETWCSFNPG